MDIAILYEDDDLLVINKPAGVIVNRADTTRHEETIQDWIEKQFDTSFHSTKERVSQTNLSYGDPAWTPEIDFYKRGGVVHRLDKETSGVLLLAKNPPSYVSLQKQFRERTVKKNYVALAHGIISPGEGNVTAPVARLPWNRTKFGIVPGGRPAKTLYHVNSFYLNPQTDETLSYVELYPESGRTHQIRVHLQYIHHPLFADQLYTGRKTARKDRQLLHRVFLHAAKISFEHPTSLKMLSFEAPLTPELTQLLTQFQKIKE